MNSSRSIWICVPKALVLIVCLGLVGVCIGLGGFFASSFIVQREMQVAWEEFEENPFEQLGGDEPLFGDFSFGLGSVFWCVGAMGMLVVLAGVPATLIITFMRYSRKETADTD